MKTIRNYKENTEYYYQRKKNGEGQGKGGGGKNDIPLYITSFTFYYYLN